MLGYPEVTLILLSNGLDPKQKDSFGQVNYNVLVVELDIYCYADTSPFYMYNRRP